MPNSTASQAPPRPPATHAVPPSFLSREKPIRKAMQEARSASGSASPSSPPPHVKVDNSTLMGKGGCARSSPCHGGGGADQCLSLFSPPAYFLKGSPSAAPLRRMRVSKDKTTSGCSRQARAGALELHAVGERQDSGSPFRRSSLGSGDAP